MREKVKVIAILATDLNGGIGEDNNLLIRISEDMKNFKETTMGHTIVMGRKTWESLPNGALPNRINVVLTNNPNLDTPNCQRMNLFKFWQKLCLNEFNTNKVFIIGGAEIYNLCFERNLIDEVIHTEINHVFENANKFVNPQWKNHYNVCNELKTSKVKFGDSELDWKILSYSIKEDLYKIIFDDDKKDNNVYMNGSAYTEREGDKEIERIYRDFPNRKNIRLEKIKLSSEK